MEESFELLRKIVPEMIQLIEKRYMILRNICFNEPIGRRPLASIISWSERRLRREVKCLEELDLIKIESKGMKVTDLGKKLILDLEDIIISLKGLRHVARTIEQKFGCRNVVVVPGNCDDDETVKMLLGKEAARILKDCICDNDIIAVTGGTTVAQIPKSINKSIEYKNVTVVPGRGGLGERVEIQANTIAAELADRLGANYRILYVPDNLGSEAMESVLSEPSIREVLSIIRNADILLHGIGGAEEMARRRGLPRDKIRQILNKGAVAEAFGFYFNKNGKIVHTTTSAGLTIKDLDKIRNIIAIAGGSEKAPAIQAFLKYRKPWALVTDEGAAYRLLELEGGNNNEKENIGGL